MFFIVHDFNFKLDKPVNKIRDEPRIFQGGGQRVASTPKANDRACPPLLEKELELEAPKF
jgi:hypothetical protein